MRLVLVAGMSSPYVLSSVSEPNWVLTISNTKLGYTLHLNSVPTSQWTHLIYNTKTTQLMLSRGLIAVYY